jgi:phosphoadenosine phosphosulfate reductase
MAPADMSALSLYAKASADFEAKLAETKAVLQNASEKFSPLTQASSLGAEDMVITHLLGDTGIACSVFVLDTGMLHAQTLALIGRIEARYDRQVLVFRPQAEAASAFVSAHGDKAMYASVELRKQCCGIRKMEPLARALAAEAA